MLLVLSLEHARSACARGPTTKNGWAILLCVKISVSNRYDGDGPACAYSSVDNLAVTNISRKFFSRLRDNIGLLRPLRINSKSGCCSRPRGALNACIYFDLFVATSAVKVVMNKIPLSTDFTVVLSKSCRLGKRLKGLSRWQLV